MAQHDYVIANQSGSAFRADLNNALAASVSTNSGSSAPSSTTAYMLWADTTNNLIKLRNSANNAWITLFTTAGGLDVDAASNFNEDVTFTGANFNVVWDKSDSSFEFADNAKALFGSSGQLEIYYNGSGAYIENTGTGSLNLYGDDVGILNKARDAWKANFITGGACKFYWAGGIRSETTDYGLKITGNSNDPASANWDTNSSIVTGGTYGGGIAMVDGSAGFVQYLSGSGADWWLKSGADDATPDTNIKATHNGSVILYYDNNPRISSQSFGVQLEATPRVDLNSTGNSVELKFNGNSGTHRGSIYADNGNTIGFVRAGSGAWAARWHSDGKQTAHGHIVPNANDTYDLGSSSVRWSTIYSNNALNTSDRNVKNTIVESDLGLDFVKQLKPVSYKWNKDDGKTHYGLIAQDIEETVLTEGKKITDFGFIDKPEEGQMSLSYSELISPLIKAVQDLSAKVEALEAK